MTKSCSGQGLAWSRAAASMNASVSRHRAGSCRLSSSYHL